jgi:SAM-dependent methyltransferase
MRMFYNVFPYPNRAFWLRPEPTAHLTAHAGFARLVARGGGDLALAESLWRRGRVSTIGADSPRAIRELVDIHQRLEELFGEHETLGLVGCGTDEPLLMRMLHPRARMEAIDLSARSLAIARWKERCARWAGAFGPSANRAFSDTRYVCAEAARHLLEEPAERYSHVQCFGVLHHQERPEALFAGLARSLRRGGTLRLMIYAHHGRRLERRIQGRYEGLWKSTESARWGALRLFLAHAKLHLWQTFQFFLGRGGVSLRFRYLGISRASVADALLHPSDPGLPLPDLRRWANAHGLRLVFCEAKSEEHGWVAGFGATRETTTTWQCIEEADARENLLSNVVAIFLKP